MNLCILINILHKFDFTAA